MTLLRVSALAAVAMALGAALPPAQAATPVPPGRWSFGYEDPRFRGKPIRVYTYRPKSCESTCPIVIAMAGVKREASRLRDQWELSADRYKLIIVAPEFSQKDWPRAARYNLGNVEEDDRQKWTFAVVERLFDEVRDGQPDYVLYGHSAGGQFAQRFALFQQPNRARLVAAGNPGWFTMPEWRKDKGAEAFPYSLYDSKAGEAQVRAALAKPFILLVGEKETDPDAESLDDSPGARRQGEGRVDRGETFIKSATALAAELGLPMKWQLVEVPETVRDAEGMSRAAAEAIFGRNK